jgi:hypothetical protein
MKLYPPGEQINLHLNNPKMTTSKKTRNPKSRVLFLRRGRLPKPFSVTLFAFGRAEMMGQGDGKFTNCKFESKIMYFGHHERLQLRFVAKSSRMVMCPYKERVQFCSAHLSSILSVRYFKKSVGIKCLLPAQQLLIVAFDDFAGFVQFGRIL